MYRSSSTFYQLWSRQCRTTHSDALLDLIASKAVPDAGYSYVVKGTRQLIFWFTLRHIRALSGLTTTKKRSVAMRAAIQVLENRNKLCSGTRHTWYRCASSPPPGDASSAAGMPTRQNSRSDTNRPAPRPALDAKKPVKFTYLLTEVRDATPRAHFTLSPAGGRIYTAVSVVNEYHWRYPQ